LRDRSKKITNPAPKITIEKMIKIEAPPPNDERGRKLLLPYPLVCRSPPYEGDFISRFKIDGEEEKKPPPED